MTADANPRVVAVIPVFRPPVDLLQRVLGLRSQVDAVVLVDDGSGSLPLPMQDGSIDQIQLEQNVGIAAALNRGIERALERGATHVLTLDQDSTIPAGYVASLLSVSGGDSESATVAVPASAGGASVLRESNHEEIPFDPIQSGQLLTAAVLRSVGPFDESLFIDAVDSDYWFRAMNANVSFVIDTEAHIEHGLGELRPIRVFGKQLVVGRRPRHVLYHSPFRTYYMVRNSLVIQRRYGKQHRARVLKRGWKMSEMVIGCLLLADDRAQQWRAIAAGYRDARSGVTGKIPAAVSAAIAPRSERS